METDSDNESDFSGFESDDLPLADLVDSDEELNDEQNDSDKENEPVRDDDKWTENDHSDHPNQAFRGPEPGPRFDIDPDQNEWDFMDMFFPMFLIELLNNLC